MRSPFIEFRIHSIIKYLGKDGTCPFPDYEDTARMRNKVSRQGTAKCSSTDETVLKGLIWWQGSMPVALCCSHSLNWSLFL